MLRLSVGKPFGAVSWPIPGLSGWPVTGLVASKRWAAAGAASVTLSAAAASRILCRSHRSAAVRT
ncbi:hypothetical protein ACU4GR_20930 [Methylobacterium oryzae CBMB20]